MPKQETDIFDERGPFKMQRWGFSNDPQKIQVKVSTDAGYFVINLDKDKPCSGIKIALAQLYEKRKEIAASFKEHYK